MKCEGCGKSPPAVSVFRVNPKGEEGIWRCAACLTPDQRANIDPEVFSLVQIIEGDKRGLQE